MTPDATTTSRLAADALPRWRRLALSARRVGHSWLAAPCRPLPAGGTEMTGLRDYAPGDDPRQVDWVLCARRDELVTRLFEGCPQQEVHLLVDCSASMGPAEGPKAQLVRRVAGGLCYAALSGGQCVRLTAFAGRVVARSDALRSEHRIGLAVRFLGELSPRDGETDLAGSAQQFVRLRQRRGPAIVLSDLYDRDPRALPRALDILLRPGYAPRVVQVFDPREAEPALLGDVELIDVESGASQTATVTERTLRRYRELFSGFCEAVRGHCRKRAVPLLTAAADADADELIRQMIGTAARSQAD
jgi:uncharacterized protein (DUF58 family)